MIVSLKRYAEQLGIPYTSLRDCAMRGEFPIIKFGRAWRVDESDMEKWIAERKAAFESERQAAIDAKRDMVSD